MAVLTVTRERERERRKRGRVRQFIEIAGDIVQIERMIED